VKKFLYAGVLATCLATPAFASTKLVIQSPEDPVHRRAVLLCIAVVIALQTLQHMPRLPARRQVPQGK
jgi:hypothetical protein